MHRLVQFFKRYYVFLLFVLLEAGAIGYYANSTSYTRSTLLAASYMATGWLYGIFSDTGEYFTLGRDNKALLERVAAAENEIAALKSVIVSADTLPDSCSVTKYFYATARVTGNSIARQENYFVLNKGLKDGVEENMAVLSVDGSVAGYVRKCSDNYAVCISVLNKNFSIGGQLKGSEYFGSVYWDGTDPREMTMLDIPRYASVAVGDTILSAYSLRFPPDCFIGTVSSVGESDDGRNYILKIRLGSKMNSISDVLLVKYADYGELETLAGEHFADTRRDNTR